MVLTITSAGAAATITGIAPAYGPADGGTTVILTGTEFTGASSVLFGSAEAASFTIDTESRITAVSPAGSAGTVHVTVTTPEGTSDTSDADEFTYVDAPVITGIAPARGSTDGSTMVVVTGSGLSGATSVMFGSIAAASFTVDSDSRITAVSPPDSLGTVHITVTTPEGTSAPSTADKFLYGASDEQPFSVILTIRPTTLNIGSKGVFTVYVTLQSEESPLPVEMDGKPEIVFDESYLACSGSELISTHVSNKNGGTLIAKFHRQGLEEVTSGDGVEITCSGTLSVNGELVDVEGSETIQVIGEKKGLDKVFSDIMKYLGLEEDESEADEPEDGTVTPPVTLNPENYKNTGQMKKALRTVTPEPTESGDADTTSEEEQDTVKKNGNGKNSRDTTAGNALDKGNKNTNKGEDAPKGNSNGKKK
jgi:hypothetical protein